MGATRQIALATMSTVGSTFVLAAIALGYGCNAAVGAVLFAANTGVVVWLLTVRS